MRYKGLVALAMAVVAMNNPVSAQEAMALSPAVETWQSFVSSPGDSLELPAEERAPQLTALGSALVADPVGVSDELERVSGGSRALRAYVAAMLKDGKLDQMVAQFHAVMLGGETNRRLADVLNAPAQQDGSVWFPQAEQAGFFAGGIAAVLDGETSDGGPAARQAIAARFALAAPDPEAKAGAWMLDAFTNRESAVSRPAAQWFEKGFDKAYR